MGLTIHYQLAATDDDEAHARKLVQQLRQAALGLPFQHVNEIVEFRGEQCDWKRRPDDDPYRWLLIQAGTHIALPVSPSEKRQGVRPQQNSSTSPIRRVSARSGLGPRTKSVRLCGVMADEINTNPYESRPNQN